MNSQRNSNLSRMEAVVIALLFIGTAMIVPIGTFAKNTQQNTVLNNPSQKNYFTSDDSGPFILDRSYYLLDPTPASTLMASDNHDGGYKRDAGNEISRSLALYPGELIDDTPGRGRTGNLSSTDTLDWYFFSVAKGMSFTITMTPQAGYNYDLGLFDGSADMVASSNNSAGIQDTITFTATYTGKYYMDVKYVSGTGDRQYTFTVVMNSQNDANTGGDVGNTFTDAVQISAGTYSGYLDMTDPYDFYKFNVNTGQGIHLRLAMKNIAYLTDFDLQLYNPSGVLVYEGNNYYDEDFSYLADTTGSWRVRVDIFPGWVDVPHPTNWSYYSYGSGAYNITLSIESSAPAKTPIPQPQITPIAKTFKVTNDPNSNKDDYGYLAAIPACNYMDGGKRYLAPIIYTGDSTPTAYYDDATSFGVVDDTTQYLVDDWNTYLNSYGKTPTQYIVPADPIQAAADIATHGWTSSSTAVVAVDGSGFNDTVKQVLKKTATLKREVSVETVPGDSAKIKSIGGAYGYPMFLGPKWCAVNVSMTGTGGATPTLGAILPLYITMSEDWWPSPYDADGKKIDIYHPINRMGIWAAGTDIVAATWTFTITKYAGDRYRFKVASNDAVIDAKLTTDSPSDLLVFLVDPQGNLRAPDLPAWNGPVNPIHVWNGLENPPVNPWRTWNPTPHTEFSAEVLHPEKGTWTAIVVPRNAEGSNVKYTLTTTVRTVNPDRADAAVSAANAAVIASQNHYPLLYVTKTSVPTATASAFTALGVTKVIFVERNDIGVGVRGSLGTIEKDLTTMKAIVDEIKSYPTSENYITLTSLKTGDGFFAPATMLAAYHGSPVIRVEDAANGDPAAVGERIHVWQRWDGDYYHGSMSTGHLPQATKEVEQNKFKVYMSLIKFFLSGTGSVPTYGLDAKRYWNEEMIADLHSYIDTLGLDKDGQEGYATVAPREDITLELHSALMGNNSYAGDIPGETPAYSSDVIVRDLLYPALIYANPGRDITTSQMMNFPDGGTWRCNDGNSYPAFSSRVVKNAFSSHLRTYEGHTFWLAHLQRINDGASVMYYSGHGTGGSGISGMYKQTSYSVYPNQIWWDAWRGYMYDAWKMPRDNGQIWFNPEPPELYDIIHYKWVDQLMGNLRSDAIFYMSCTTGDGDAPMVYLDHGALCWYGNAGTGLCPEADLADDNFFNDTMISGVPIGPAFSHQVWLHYRDYTTGDPTSMYGSSSMQVTTIQVIYGDPNLIIYSPEWTSPVPVDA